MFFFGKVEAAALDVGLWRRVKPFTKVETQKQRSSTDEAE